MLTQTESPLRAFYSIPRHELIGGPTPLRPAANLAKAFGGPELWLKRDDLIPFGFGGNKVRGLEFIVADALAKGADTLVTGAGSLSNHVRATAAAAREAGLAMEAVYWGDAPDEVQGNYRLTRMLGAEVHFTGDLDRSSVDGGIAKVVEQSRAAGHTPYPIPRGGACPLGVVGHVLAVEELMIQCREAGFAPDLIFLAVGSGTTLAGWLLGSRLLGAPWRIEGVTVSRPAEEARTRAANFAREAAGLAGIACEIEPNEITVHEGFIGEGYGIASPEGNAAIEKVARTAGIFLDPVYTGKTFAAYLHLLGQGRFHDVSRAVFMHTGGEPSLFVGKGT